METRRKSLRKSSSILLAKELHKRRNENIREFFPNQASFIFIASIASLSFEGIFRFPYLAAKYNGLSFMVVLLLVYLILIVPLLTLELSLGNIFPLSSFASISPKARGLRLASLFLLILALISNTTLTSYAWNYVVVSCFSPSLVSNNDGELITSTSVFYEQVAQYSVYSGISISLIGGVAFTLIALSASLVQSFNTYLRIVTYTSAVSLILLLGLMCYSFTLPGSISGLEYLFGSNFQWNLLYNQNVWLDAVYQALSSSGACMSVFTVLGASRERGKEMVSISLLVPLVNAIVCLSVAVFVYNCIGFTSFTHNTPILGYVSSSMSLAFVVLPLTMSSSPALSAFFFLSISLLLLSISLVYSHCILTMICESYIITSRQIKRSVCVVGVVVLLMLSCLCMCSSQGLVLLDVVTMTFSSFLLPIVAVCECVSISWLYSFNIQRRQIGLLSLLVWSITFLLSSFVYIMCPFPSNLIAFAVMLTVGLIVAIATAKSPFASGDDRYSSVWWLICGGVQLARNDIKSSITSGSWLLLSSWSMCVKYVCPLCCLALLLFNISTDIEHGYKGYNGGYVCLSVLLVLYVLFCVCLPLHDVVNQYLENLQPAQGTKEYSVETPTPKDDDDTEDMQLTQQKLLESDSLPSSPALLLNMGGELNENQEEDMLSTSPFALIVA